MERDIVIIGAGPAGALLAGMLAGKGDRVMLVDKRRTGGEEKAKGRTIQLSLSPRGRRALLHAGFDISSEGFTIPLLGRALHPAGEDGVRLQRIPDDRLRNHSVNRHELSRRILAWAMRQGRIETHFGWNCIGLTRRRRSVVLENEDGDTMRLHADLVVGADGAGSEVRNILMRPPWSDFMKYASPWGYAEICVPPSGGLHRWQDPAIHIWPRDRFFVVAFPATDGSYRGTLVARHEDWPMRGRKAPQESAFTDASLLTSLHDLWPHRAEGNEGILKQPLVDIPIVRCGHVEDGDWLVIIGDAAHATAPFMGQGVNLAMEDASCLARQLALHFRDIPAALKAYGRERCAEGLACCDLSDRAAGLLLHMPPPGGDPAAATLARLNLEGNRYSDVARLAIAGWEPRVIPVLEELGDVDRS